MLNYGSTKELLVGVFKYVLVVQPCERDDGLRHVEMTQCLELALKKHQPGNHVKKHLKSVDDRKTQQIQKPLQNSSACQNLHRPNPGFNFTNLMVFITLLGSQ
jgi:ABC-type ATPase with predicted acetyltransferase domain